MQDFRDAFRALKATPVVTIVAILSLALGIGANTAIFSILDSLMLRTLPVKAPQQLVLLGEGTTRTSWTNPIWEQVRERQRLFDGAFAWSGTRFNLAQGGPTELVDGMWASGGLFDVLGVPAILGRTFTEADDRRGGGPDGPVAVISYRLLAAALRRRRGRDRPIADGRARAVHDRRRHAARVLRRGRRPDVRRRDSDRHRAAHPRQGVVARWALELVAERHDPAEGGSKPRSRQLGAPGRPAADPRSHDAAGLAPAGQGRHTSRRASR